MQLQLLSYKIVLFQTDYEKHLTVEYIKLPPPSPLPSSAVGSFSERLIFNKGIVRQVLRAADWLLLNMFRGPGSLVVGE